VKVALFFVIFDENPAALTRFYVGFLPSARGGLRDATGIRRAPWRKRRLAQIEDQAIRSSPRLVQAGTSAIVDR
jgi:hypothetical protein